MERAAEITREQPLTAWRTGFLTGGPAVDLDDNSISSFGSVDSPRVSSAASVPRPIAGSVIHRIRGLFIIQSVIGQTVAARFCSRGRTHSEILQHPSRFRRSFMERTRSALLPYSAPASGEPLAENRFAPADRARRARWRLAKLPTGHNIPRRCW